MSVEYLGHPSDRMETDADLGRDARTSAEPVVAIG